MLTKGNQDDELHQVVYLCAEALRITGILLQPYMPEKAASLLDMLGVRLERRTAAYAILGSDFDYGASETDLGKGELGTLFPPQISYD
jgi:methionyl-tRNA synthetase